MPCGFNRNIDCFAATTCKHAIFHIARRETNQHLSYFSSQRTGKVVIADINRHFNGFFHCLDNFRMPVSQVISPAVDMHINQLFSIQIIKVRSFPITDNQVNTDFVENSYFIRTYKLLVLFNGFVFECAHFIPIYVH